MKRTKKLAALLALYKERGIPATFPSHEAAYWHAAQLGLAYDPTKGWHEPPTRRGRDRRIGVRIEGSFNDCVMVEMALRELGHTPATRRGPDRGNGDAWLTYLSLPLAPMQRAPAVRRRRT